MPFFPLLLAVGIANVGTSYYLNKETLDKGELMPKVMGYDTRNVIMGAGLLLAVFGTPMLAFAGLAAASAAYNNKDTVDRVVTGLKEIVQKELSAHKAEIDAKLTADGKLIDYDKNGDRVPKPPPPPPSAEVPPPPRSPGAMWDSFSSTLFNHPVPNP